MMEKLSRPQFSKSLSGYKTEEVDSYVEKLLEQIGSLQEVNETLEEKIGVLAESIQRYREDEDSLREALLGAQKMADSIIKNANNKAEIAMREASVKAAHILQDARQKVEDEKSELIRVQEEAADFKSKLINMYREHIEVITRIPAVEKDAPAVEEEPVEEQTVEQAAAEEHEEVVADVVEPMEEVAIEEAAPFEMPEEAAEEMPVEETPAEETAVEEEPVAVAEEPEETPIPELGRDIFEEFERKKSEILNFDRQSDKATVERRTKFSDLKFGDGFNLLDDEDF